MALWEGNSIGGIICASGAASEFCEWIYVRIDVYISHHKYRIKPHSSAHFLAACAAAIVHRNHFFHLYQENEFSESKVNFRPASNCSKGFFKLTYANKTKESITSQKLDSQDFEWIAKGVLSKGKSAQFSPLFTAQKCFVP